MTNAFLDMTGTSLLYPDPAAIAHIIKDTIFSELGFTVNVGIAPNKLLAKMASDFEKPDKVHTLFAHEIPQKLWPLPVGSLFSVGRSTAEKLTAARIRTIGDLAQADLAYIQRLTGVKLGKLIHDYANGIDDAPVLAEPEAVKGYGNSVTLEQDVTTPAQANQILLALCDSVASRMRADSRRCTCVTVTIRGNDFRNRSHQRRLPEPTDVTAELYALSRVLFSELWDGVTPLRLLGVTLNDLCGDDAVQLSLFHDEKKERARKLDHAVDQLREKIRHHSHLTRQRHRRVPARGPKIQSRIGSEAKINYADIQIRLKNSAQSSGNVRAATSSGATSGISAISCSPPP